MLSRQYTEFKDYGSYVVSKTNEVPRSLYCQQNWLFSQREQNVIQKQLPPASCSFSLVLKKPLQYICGARKQIVWMTSVGLPEMQAWEVKDRSAASVWKSYSAKKQKTECICHLWQSPMLPWGPLQGWTLYTLIKLKTNHLCSR